MEVIGGRAATGLTDVISEGGERKAAREESLEQAVGLQVSEIEEWLGNGSGTVLWTLVATISIAY